MATAEITQNYYMFMYNHNHNSMFVPYWNTTAEDKWTGIVSGGHETKYWSVGKHDPCPFIQGQHTQPMSPNNGQLEVK